MWTTATSVPKRGCPPLVLDKVLWSEDSETLDGVCKVLPIKEKVAKRVKIVYLNLFASQMDEFKTSFETRSER